MLLACTTGGRFAILVAAEPARPMLADLVRSYGLAERLASVRVIGVNVLDVAADPYTWLSRVLDRVREAVRQDGASAVLLGCASLAPLAPALTAQAGVPVIDGVAAAVKALEARVTMRTLARQAPIAGRRKGVHTTERSEGIGRHSTLVMRPTKEVS